MNSLHNRKLLFQSFFLFLLLANHVLVAQNHYPVKINQKWGLMNAQGEIVVAPQYEVIGMPQAFGYTQMQQNEKVGLLDKRGNILIPAIYEEIKVLDSNFIKVTELGQQKVVNAQGKIVLDKGNFEKLQVINQQYLGFSKEDVFGCVGTDGIVILPPKYATIELFQEQFFKVSNGNQYGLANLTGKLILNTIADNIKVFKNKLIFYQKGVLWGATNSQGKTIISPKYLNYSIVNQQLIKLERYGEHWLFDIQSESIVSSQPMQDFLPFSDKYVLTRRGENFGLVDYSAKEILNPQYQEIQPFSATAFRIRNGWKWGIINRNSEQVLPYDYDFIAPSRNGRALIKKGNFFGLLNNKGELVVPAEYTRITISGENIKAFKGSKWTLFYFDEDGVIKKGKSFKKHFKIKIAEQNPMAGLGLNNQGVFQNETLLDDFEWFKDFSSQKWGLRKLSDGEEVIPPTFDVIKVEKDLGYTIVGIEKQGQYRFDRTNYRFNFVYGIVNNKVGKLVSHLKLWDVRSEDFRQGSLVARVVFDNGRHGLMLRNGKFVKKDFGYIGEFKDGLAKISISGRVAAKLNPEDKSLGRLSSYLNSLMVGSDMIDFTIHDQKIEGQAYLTCEDCSWGFIDTTAYITIQPKYEVANDFINDACIVKHKEKWGVIDSLGNTLIAKKYDGVEFLEGTDNQIIKLSTNTKKYGLMDTLGQLLVDLKYDEISDFQEDRLAVKKDNLWGFVDQSGQEIIPPKFQKAEPFSEGLAAVKYQRKWIFIDPQGEIQIDNNYRAIGNFRQGKAWVKTGEGVGYISPDNRMIIPPVFNQAYDFEDGIARVVVEGKYGLIDEKGQYILRPKFSRIYPFDEQDLAIVRYGNRVTRYGVINRNGELITTQNFQKIESFKEGRALVKHREGYGFIDPLGQLIIEGNYSKAANFQEGRAMVQKDNRCGYIDITGREVIPLIYSKCLDFEDGKAVVYEGLKKGGVIELNGEEIIEPGINRLIDFKEGRGLVRNNYDFYYIDEQATWRDGYFEKAERYQHGIAVIRKNGRYGIINRNGLNIISNKYDQIADFENGFAKVRLRQFVGLADVKGKIIIPPNYEFITYAGDDLFRVENGGQIGYLRKNGTWIWALQE